MTSENDFRQLVDLVPEPEGHGYRLRMGADTVGTADDTVKFLGLRSKRRLSPQELGRLSRLVK